VIEVPESDRDLVTGSIEDHVKVSDIVSIDSDVLNVDKILAIKLVEDIKLHMVEVKQLSKYKRYEESQEFIEYSKWLVEDSLHPILKYVVEYCDSKNDKIYSSIKLTVTGEICKIRAIGKVTNSLPSFTKQEFRLLRERIQRDGN
jgi:hypothetical protein